MKLRSCILGIIEANVFGLGDVADFQQKAQYEAPKFELVQMFNRDVSGGYCQTAVTCWAVYQ